MSIAMLEARIAGMAKIIRGLFDRVNELQGQLTQAYGTIAEINAHLSNELRAGSLDEKAEHIRLARQSIADLKRRVQ